MAACFCRGKAASQHAPRHTRSLMAAAVCARAPVQVLQLTGSQLHAPTPPHRCYTSTCPVCRGHGCGHAHPPQRLAPHACRLPFPPSAYSGNQLRRACGGAHYAPPHPPITAHGRASLRAPRVVHLIHRPFRPPLVISGRDTIAAPSCIGQRKAGPQPASWARTFQRCAAQNCNNGPPPARRRLSHGSKGRLRRRFAISSEALTLDSRETAQ